MNEAQNYHRQGKAALNKQAPWRWSVAAFRRPDPEGYLRLGPLGCAMEAAAMRDLGAALIAAADYLDSDERPRSAAAG